MYCSSLKTNARLEVGSYEEIFFVRPIKVLFSFWLTIPNNPVTQLTYLH